MAGTLLLCGVELLEIIAQRSVNIQSEILAWWREFSCCFF
jgi:hypothetical protein